MSTTRLNFTKAELSSLPTPKALKYYRDIREPRLGLYITSTGAKSFFALVRANHQTRRAILGKFPDLSIPLARIRAAEAASETARTGVAPAQLKRDSKASQITLNEVLDIYIEEKDLKPGTIKDYRKAIRETFGDYINKPIILITEKVVLKQYKERGKASKARTDNAARVRCTNRNNPNSAPRPFNHRQSECIRFATRYFLESAVPSGLRSAKRTPD